MTRPRLIHPVVFAIAAGVMGTSLGCGGESYGAADPSEVARAQAAQRLMGEWVLVSFQPDSALEPMFASLLTAQFGVMVVRFDGQTMEANGTGVRVQRRYRVTQASGDQLALVNYDDNNIAYDAVGQFRGNELWFTSETEPWRGHGVLRRAR